MNRSFTPTPRIHALRSYTRGFTVLELLVTIAILGIVLAIGFPQLGTPGARAFSNDLQSAVQRGRFEAVKRNNPVMVSLDTNAGRVQLRASSDNTVSGACGVAATVIVEHTTEEYRATSFSTTVAGQAIVWLPNGRPVTCTGSPLIAGEVSVSDASRTIVLDVDVGGRVSVQ